MRESNGIQTAVLKLHVIQGMNKMHSRLIQNLRFLQNLSPSRPLTTQHYPN